MNKEFYNSKAWNSVRKNVWLKQKCLCARCHKAVYVDGISDYIPKERRLKGIVHHITHLNETNVYDDDIALDENNLVGLCIYCHNEIHKSKQATKPNYTFDNEGNLIEWGNKKNS